MKLKQQLRKEARTILNNLDNRWLAAASRELSNNLNNLLQTPSFQDTGSCLAWVPFFPGEADLSDFISEQIGDRDIYLPKSSTDGALKFISIGSEWLQAMSCGALGIPEPDAAAGTSWEYRKDGPPAIVLVPGLYFNTQGERLGRGKGFYDRFLRSAEEAGQKLIKVGICWQLQVVPQVPTERFDINMDWICTEEGAQRCQS